MSKIWDVKTFMWHHCNRSSYVMCNLILSLSLSVSLSVSMIPWWRHQMETFSALLAICAGNSPGGTKAIDAELWCFFFICVWIIGWVNNCEAGDLRSFCAHYDVAVMLSLSHLIQANHRLGVHVLLLSNTPTALTSPPPPHHHHHHHHHHPPTPGYITDFVNVSGRSF